MRQRAAETVEFPDNEHIALANIGEGFGQARPVGPGTRRKVLEDQLAASLLQGIELQRKLLLTRRHTCISDVGHGMLPLSAIPSSNLRVRLSVVKGISRTTSGVAARRSFAGQPAPAVSCRKREHFRMSASAPR